MKPFSFHPTVLLRVPYFAYTKHKSLSLQDSMDLTAVRNAQLLAAPTFYDILKKTGFKEETLNAKQRQTIENYLNRMHYRCTPFGLFAGTLPANWSDDKASEIIIGASRMAQTLPSFGTEMMALHQLKEHSSTGADIRYSSNPASMPVGNEMRYLTVSTDPSKESIREYKLKSIAVDKSFKELWAFCSQPLSAAAIIDYFSQQYEMDEDESAAFFQNLVDEQILLSDLEPNITGAGYAERLLEIFNENDNDFLSLSKCLTIQASATAPLPPAFETRFDDQIRSNCYAHLSMQALEDHKSISNQYQEHISEGFYAIQKMLPMSESADLESFKMAFIDKFDQRCIPLLEALDPELGVNYAGLSNAQDQSEILEKLDAKNGSSPQKKIQWSEVHTMLLQKWQSSKNSKDPIFLDDTAIDKLPSADQPFPSSISTIFKIHNNSVVLETIGGATSTSILGRFSTFHKEAEDCCKDSANTEIELNPGVLFAEIVSIEDTHAANIEKRQQFYHFEIPILTTSLLPYERQIQLNDLYLMVRGNKIVLFSAKYGKEVIPRLSTAFNSQRSTLGIYRFLCDLQFQGIRKITPFQMDRFFPDLSFYPRIIYKKAILQLAIWHIKKDDIAHILNGKNPESKALQLSEYLKRLNVPAVFALKEHDNQLIFKMDDANDLLSFADNIKNIDRITIEEFPFTEANALIKDENGESYQHQIVATMVNNSTVYEGSQLLIQQALSTLGSNNESFMPGSTWMYLKIYCHQSFADTILLKKIKPLLKQIKGFGEIEKWFFLRYTDPDFHLRIRIFIRPAMQGAALELLNQSLKKELNAGLITKIQLDTYKPEWERYGHHLLPATEDCFYRGSEWMLQLLQLQHRGQKDNIEIAMLNIHSIFNLAALGIGDRKDLLLKMHQSLFAEHALDKQDQIELGNKYRNYKERISLWLPHNDRKTKAQADFEKSLHRCFAKMEKSSPHLKNAWIADLIHMQLNRVFADQARKKEMVVYYLMSKWYLSEEKKGIQMSRGIMELV
jgi:thiopeptide-type bacteriocin biosynthesis protein